MEVKKLYNDKFGNKLVNLLFTYLHYINRKYILSNAFGRNVTASG